MYETIPKNISELKQKGEISGRHPVGFLVERLIAPARFAE